MRNETKARIRSLGFKSYRGYLLSETWRKRRERYFRTHQRRCWICGIERATIHLHHANYERLGGHERDSDLVPLCSPHHRGLHTYMKRRRVPVERAHLAYKRYLSERRKTDKAKAR